MLQTTDPLFTDVRASLQENGSSNHSDRQIDADKETIALRISTLSFS